MDLSPLLNSVPAAIALTIKAGIFLYARFSPVHNRVTSIFLLGLFALSIQNLAEISHFFTLASGGIPVFELSLWYVSGIMAMTLMFHLAVSLALEGLTGEWRRWLYYACYSYGTLLIVFLISGDQLVKGFEQIEHTATRIPGPIYFLFEIFAIVTSIGLIGLFCYGSLRQVTAQRRAQNTLLLVGILPALCVVVALIALLHFGIKTVNATIILPFASTVFLVVCAYAIYQYRIFDIQFFIPWSKVRRRKTAFHKRIRQLIAEIADLPSANEAVTRISETLGCPVIMLGLNRKVFAGNADKMALLEPSTLRDIDHILVTNEVADSKPRIYRQMKDHGVAAVVPFCPHNENVSGWLLLGDSFNDEVYSSLDFRLVEELFGKMSELFLDKFVTLRAQLKTANKQIRSLRAENEELQNQARVLRREVDTLNSRRESDQGHDAEPHVARATEVAHSVLGSPVTLVARDKAMLGLLRETFRDVKAYVGPGSAALKRCEPPEVLVCRVGRNPSQLAKRLEEWRATSAVLLYGPGAADFAQRYRSMLRSALIDVIPEGFPPNTIVRRTHRLLHLRKHCHWLGNDEHPLIGMSPVFMSFIQRLQMVAGFTEPMLLLYDDLGSAKESARYLHRQSDAEGEVVFTRMESLHETVCKRGPEDLVAALDVADNDIPTSLKVMQQLNEETGTIARVLVGFQLGKLVRERPELEKVFREFVIRLPKLHQRRDDIPMLVHYFTLQFNINSGTFVNLSQEEIKSLKLHEPAGWTLAGLRSATIGFLSQKARQVSEPEGLDVIENFDVSAEERSLDELMAEFESRIIRSTLERCSGNKSKTARLLGLRPNTLHYKLLRYGINGSGEEE